MKQRSGIGTEMVIHKVMEINSVKHEGKKWVEYVGVKYMPKNRKHDPSGGIQNSRKVGWKISSIK